MTKEYICEIDYDKDPCVVYREPLVRCKDCKHHERLMHLCRKFDEYGLAETDYCSRGDRKNEVEE